MTPFDHLDRTHPRVVEALSRAGWTPQRRVEVSPDFDAMASSHGYYLHDHELASEFLRAFGGLSVEVPSRRGHGVRGFDVASLATTDRMLTKLDLSATFLHVERLAGSSTLYPVMTAGGDVIFALPDGRAMALEQTFQGVVHAPDLFSMMHWILFDEALPGVRAEAIPNEERPIRFRWR